MLCDMMMGCADESNLVHGCADELGCADEWNVGCADECFAVPDPLGGCQNGPIFTNVREIFEPILDDFGVDFVRIHMFLICSHYKVSFYKVILCCIIFESTTWALMGHWWGHYKIMAYIQKWIDRALQNQGMRPTHLISRRIFYLQERCQLHNWSHQFPLHIELCFTALPRPSTNSLYSWKRCKPATWVGLLRFSDQVPWQLQITSRESRILRRSEETPSPPNSVSRQQPGDSRCHLGRGSFRRMSKTAEEDPQVKPLKLLRFFEYFWGNQI
jgi:hypothetical protein